MTSHAILYDPDCGFCRVCVALLLRWDRHGRLRPVALTSTEGMELLAGMPDDQRMASWHLVPADRTIRSAGAAFSPLFRLLPGGAPLARLTDRFPETVERAYCWVADHRTAFGKPLPAAVKRWADRVISESARNSR
jgi:predicted DCC family thiol-disulfide oxidoreductase YuxK